MARIRHIEIKNFRSIKSLNWFPAAGINCLIGPGDSGKTTILDAIDLCLGARRNIYFSDADFYNLDVSNPISINITLGELDDGLMNIDSHGLYLRGFDSEKNLIEDEPKVGIETVLTIQLKVEEDLEPSWQLFSDRAEAQGQQRSLAWGERLKLAPNRLGNFTNYDLSWKKGSIISRITTEKVDTSSAMLKVNREARAAFGKEANEQLKDARAIVKDTAVELGISVGEDVNALMDLNSISTSSGTISLHSEQGVPLSNLGVGSSRLLLAGLQRKAGEQANILLVDELEYGLEPHRLIRLLGSLGSKEKKPPLQVFMTTHSPVAIRELSGNQLFSVKKSDAEHEVFSIGLENSIQGAVRLFPEAFLAPSVLVCEGATEVGFVRGIDLYRVLQGKPSIMALGVALVDAGGVKKLYGPAKSFQKFKGKVAVLRDDDEHPDENDEKDFIALGGKLLLWTTSFAIEDEIFQNVSADAGRSIISKVIELYGEDLVNDHIKTVSSGAVTLDQCLSDFENNRSILAKAAKNKNNSWFKTISKMEDIAFNIIGPDVEAKESLIANIQNIFDWIASE